ncbi:MAG: MBL fold metallo-hydrolase [Candidatus Bipolaricaulota bacterium]|nr:MBL fold metallo-hydrolase [Candidatus Bipolaricaulota bacterium]
MRKLWSGSLIVVAVAVCVPAMLSAAQAASASTEVRVTYVGNAGFLITVGDKKVLIDAMFRGFPGGYKLPANVADALQNARPPFDGVDLILATHNHADHFSADMVRRHMEANPEAILVAGPQVAGQLSAFGTRVVTLTATAGKAATTTQNEITIEAIYLCHGVFPAGQKEVVNYGYVVTIGDVSFFHMGDMDPDTVGMGTFRSYGLANEQLDFAFIEHFYLAGTYAAPDLVAAIAAKYIIPAHYEYTTVPMDRSAILRTYPGAILFAKELDSWTMPNQ